MRYAIANCLIAILLITPANAAPKAEPRALDAKNRPAEDGRSVLVELAQTEIATDVDIGRVAFPGGGGGLLGALIISAQDDSRKRLTESAQARADAAVAPLRQALADFDVAALALRTTHGALDASAWFTPRDIALERSPSDSSREGFIQSVSTRQFAVISYTYGLSPDFTQIRVVADVILASKPAKGRPGAFQVLLRQRVSSVAELRQRSYEAADNVAVWRAEDGKIAEASLTAAFAKLERLVPFALGLQPADLDRLDAASQPKVFASGFYGPKVELAPALPGENVLWVDGGLLDVWAAPSL
ncbi:MAG: hypothetical protein P0Y56_07365 [Candidatus Andeanibacterium colombiense]|uniref:Uncharacterized protein n=1 Tax=Candidatus Andeanibacterium colombiense TaxID=3121345 RepID=A0AAJ5X5E0_9SPHN|nr:MAG: hypothetical protein P0Y56_07365 [Sphingomonadaceae bacterium]